MTPIRVVLIEDHDLTRVGLRISLQHQGVEVVAEAATGQEGLQRIAALQPDVAVVDLGLPDLDGIEVTRRIKENGSSNGKAVDAPKVVILTFQDHPQAVLAAFAAGADSYCMKDVSPEQLLEAIQITHEGNHWIDPAIAGFILQQSRSQSAPPPLPNSEQTNLHNLSDNDRVLAVSPLTERELDVLQLIVEGYSNAQIAEKLYITIGTVKTHVRNILNKLSADDRTQAAVRALRSGLIR